MKGNDRVYLIAAFICFILLAILAAFNYEGQKDPTDTFVNSYYEGYKIDSMDSKSLYSALNAYNNMGETACIVNPRTVDSDKIITVCDQTLPWIQMSGDTTKAKAEEFAKIEGGCLPFSDGDYIIAPGDLTFINSNVSSNINNKSIQAYIGTKYKIEFSHIAEWWCHMDAKVEDYRHSDVVGHGSNNNTDRVIVGTIIGKATSSTVASIWVKQGDEWVPCSWEDYYKDTY